MLSLDAPSTTLLDRLNELSTAIHAETQNILADYAQRTPDFQ